LAATASPSTICPGAVSLLSGSSPGRYIRFYDAASGGTLLGGAPSGSTIGVSPVATTTYYAESVTFAPGGSSSFTYTGAMQMFTVPTGATSVTIEAFGAQGRSADGAYVGGLGARMKGTFTVTGGDQLIVLTGQQGITLSSSSGGGGGGSFVVKVDPASSDIISSGPFAGTRVTPLVIAGGGGGTRTSVSANGNPGVTTNTATTASGASMSGGGSVSGTTPGLGGITSSFSWGSAGGGFRGYGASDGGYGTGGTSFLAGGAGGINSCGSGGACGGACDHPQ
jgi:hypothetical protein